MRVLHSMKRSICAYHRDKRILRAIIKDTVRAGLHAAQPPGKSGWAATLGTRASPFWPGSEELCAYFSHLLLPTTFQLNIMLITAMDIETIILSIG